MLSPRALYELFTVANLSPSCCGHAYSRMATHTTHQVLYALCARSGGVELPPCALQDSVERQWAEHAALKGVTGSEAQFDAEDLFAAIKVQAAWRGNRSRAKMLLQAEMVACAHHAHGSEATQSLLVSLLGSAGLLPAQFPEEEEGAAAGTQGALVPSRSPIKRERPASSIL